MKIVVFIFINFSLFWILKKRLSKNLKVESQMKEYTIFIFSLSEKNKVESYESWVNIMSDRSERDVEKKFLKWIKKELKPNEVKRSKKTKREKVKSRKKKGKY